MSTSYYVHCLTCSKDVTDRDACDNHPEIPVCIVKNIIPYTHLAMFLAELPVPRTSWLDYEVKLSGFRIDLENLRKHCMHKLAVYDEYGRQYGARCPHCDRRSCGKLPCFDGTFHMDPCCQACTTHPVET